MTYSVLSLIVSVLYIVFYFFILAIINLNIVTLLETRKSLSAKSRNIIDKDIGYLNNCKKISFVWPYALYLLIKLNNGK